MNGELSHTIPIYYTTCTDEGLNTLQCYATCVDKRWNSVQIYLLYAAGGDEVEVVQLRGGTNHNNHFFCNLCRWD